MDDFGNNIGAFVMFGAGVVSIGTLIGVLIWLVWPNGESDRMTIPPVPAEIASVNVEESTSIQETVVQDLSLIHI